MSDPLFQFGGFSLTIDTAGRPAPTYLGYPFDLVDCGWLLAGIEVLVHVRPVATAPTRGALSWDLQQKDKEKYLAVREGNEIRARYNYAEALILRVGLQKAISLTPRR